MNIKILSILFLSLFQTIIGADKKFNQDIARISIEALQAKLGNSENDKLTQAIINRDVEKVIEYSKKIDLNDELYESILDKNSINNLFSKNNDDPIKSKIEKIYLLHNYLSIAILNTLRDSSDAEKKDSIKVLEILLKNKANVNFPRWNKKEQLYGLGYSVIINEERDGKQFGVPYEFFCPLIFYPVMYHCQKEVLELLFKYGAKADAKLDGFNGHDTLLEYAKKENVTELIDIIDKELSQYDEFRKSEVYNYLSKSMQDLYESLNHSIDKDLFVQVCRNLDPIIYSNIMQLIDDQNLNNLPVCMYLDVCDDSDLIIKRNRNAINKQLEDVKAILKEKFVKNQINFCNNIKPILKFNNKIRETLVELCKSQNKRLYLVLSLASPCSQYICSDDPIIAAAIIDL